MKEHIRKIQDIFEGWDVRGIIDDNIEPGYENGVMHELLNACEKLVQGIEPTEHAQAEGR